MQKINYSKRKFHRIGLQKVQEFIKNKWNGQCLSDNYINCHTKLLLECQYQHQWEATWSSIRVGKWCPQCSTLSGERITRLFFENIFNNKFLKFRADWLRNSHGYKMELDGYCSELGIGFEHHGLQHYQINQFSNTFEKLAKRQQDDKHKIALCQAHKIKLIIVPQVPNLIPLDKLKNFIFEKCQEMNIIYPTNLDLQINFNLEPISYEYLKIYQKIAESKGGKCLSDVYVNSGEKLLFECQNKHQWKAIPDNIKNKGTWCPICRRRKNKNDS